MRLSGKQLRNLIILAGLQNEKSDDIGAILSFNLGIEAPQGSIRRALSQARGTWSAEGNTISLYSHRYEKTKKSFHGVLPGDENETMYLNENDEVVSIIDIRVHALEAHGGIPMEFWPALHAFQDQVQVGGKVSQAVRDGYERCMDWIYFNLGLVGAEARQYADDSRDQYDEWLSSQKWEELKELEGLIQGLLSYEEALAEVLREE